MEDGSFKRPREDEILVCKSCFDAEINSDDR